MHMFKDFRNICNGKNDKTFRKSILTVGRYRNPNPRPYDGKASAHPICPTGLGFERFLFADKLNVFCIATNLMETRKETNGEPVFCFSNELR